MKRYANQSETPKRGLSLGMRCLLILILIVSVGVFASKMLTYRQLGDEMKKLETEKAELEEKIKEMNHYLNGPVDYDEIVRIAREKFHLAFPDETIYYNGRGKMP